MLVSYISKRQKRTIEGLVTTKLKTLFIYNSSYLSDDEASKL